MKLCECAFWLKALWLKVNQVVTTSDNGFTLSHKEVPKGPSLSKNLKTYSLGLPTLLALSFREKRFEKFEQFLGNYACSVRSAVEALTCSVLDFARFTSAAVVLDPRFSVPPSTPWGKASPVRALLEAATP